MNASSITAWIVKSGATVLKQISQVITRHPCVAMGQTTSASPLWGCTSSVEVLQYAHPRQRQGTLLVPLSKCAP